MIRSITGQELSALQERLCLEEVYILYSNLFVRADRCIALAQTHNEEICLVGTYLKGLPFHAFTFHVCELSKGRTDGNASYRLVFPCRRPHVDGRVSHFSRALCGDRQYRHFASPPKQRMGNADHVGHLPAGTGEIAARYAYLECCCDVRACRTRRRLPDSC
ncbi:hypothetical protein O3V59_04865 [Brevibacillus thermoruber]|uniref:Uncharacterized protein n=1 Tax=Brevibacillus thermoruber TaxID=33942 RepID=A0A9X3TNL5_9BACL|nr:MULTISPECIES: hypothetical protein [Brevibacillus]MDA5107683.1 hypothetical protein [Brevibacillus thermoruber]UYZ14978.1 hypothetical protein A6764_08625 [Brevibacillus sp. WF146]